MRRRTSQETINYILEHEQHMTRAALAKKCGVAISTIRNILLAYGRPLKTYGQRLMPPQLAADKNVLAKIRELWPMYSSTEIETMTGINKRRVTRWAKIMGLTHTVETEERIREKQSAAARVAIARLDHVAAGRKIKMMRALDMKRLLAGEPQKTKYKFNLHSYRINGTRYHLKHYYNYYQTEENSLVFYYDSQTRRAKREDYFARRYGIKFEEGEEE